MQAILANISPNSARCAASINRSLDGVAFSFKRFADDYIGNGRALRLPSSRDRFECTELTLLARASAGYRASLAILAGRARLAPCACCIPGARRLLESALSASNACARRLTTASYAHFTRRQLSHSRHLPPLASLYVPEAQTTHSPCASPAQPTALYPFHM